MSLGKLKKKILDTAGRLPAVSRARAKRKVRSILMQHLPKETVSLCEREPEKKAETVRQFFEQYPDRFAGDQKAAERVAEQSPNFADAADKEAVRTELLFDRIAYGFHPEEIVCYELDRKTPQERKAFISSRGCMHAVYRMNDINGMDVFNNKGKTYAAFGPYYRRDAVYLAKQSDLAAFRAFAEKHPVFVKKAVFEAMGRSIERVDIVDCGMSADEYFAALMKDGAHILEECVQQCSVMAALNSSSVNTVRSITFNTRHGIEQPYFFMKIGRAGSFVDNGGAGGILVGIDNETGELCTDGFDEMNNRYPQHPDSGVVFKGYQLPDFAQLKALSAELSAKMPSVKYIGWDFAHTDDGWVIIEGNGRSQMIGPQTVFKRGIKAEVKGFMQDMDLIF